MPKSNRNMEDDRLERVQNNNAHGDMAAGDEGLDDPSMSRVNRDDMRATPKHGDRIEEGRDSNRRESQRSHRTGKRANDERYDTASSFSGQGAQKEGAMEEAEGTGYTDDSTTEDNRRENPSS